MTNFKVILSRFGKKDTFALLRTVVRTFLVVALTAILLFESTNILNPKLETLLYGYILFGTGILIGAIISKRKHFPLLFRENFLRGSAAHSLGVTIIIVNALLLLATTIAALSLP
jgi:hypothetical protein